MYVVYLLIDTVLWFVELVQVELDSVLLIECRKQVLLPCHEAFRDLCDLTLVRHQSKGHQKGLGWFFSGRKHQQISDVFEIEKDFEKRVLYVACPV